MSGGEYLCYTDGSCKAGAGAAGGWGYCIRVPGGAPLEGYGKARGTLAKTMEYQAVAEALAVLPEKVAVVVFSDNQALVENMTRNLDHWRAAGFSAVDPLVLDSVRRVDAAIREKGLTVKWQWLRGHNGNEGNERADHLAAQGAREMKAELATEEEQERRAGRRKSSR